MLSVFYVQSVSFSMSQVQERRACLYAPSPTPEPEEAGGPTCCAQLVSHAVLVQSLGT